MNAKLTSIAIAAAALGIFAFSPAEAKGNEALLNQIAMNNYLAQTAAAQAAAQAQAQAQLAAQTTVVNPSYLAYNTCSTPTYNARTGRPWFNRFDQKRDEHRDRDHGRTRNLDQRFDRR